MTRDWRKVALAVLTAAALGSVCALDTHAQSGKQPAKAAKAPAKAPQAEEDAQADEQADAEKAKPAAKKKRQDPAEAQRVVEAAHKLLQGGKADQAIQTLTGTLAGGNLPPAIMAKALYLRGMAYRQQSKPALAISDLTSALWLKGGLAEADRADAAKQRAAAYADAGLSESGEALAAGKERQASNKGWFTSSEGDSGSSSGGGGNWFSSMFGGQSKAAQDPPPSPPPPVHTGSIQKTEPPSPPPVAAAPPPASPRVSSAWSSKTQVKAENVAAVSPPVPAAAKVEGKYRVQLAIVRTEPEARALALKAKRELAGAIATREPEIDQTVFGNMGAFYRVRVGPFATVQETQAVCAKVKGTGFDCMTVTQ